MTRKPKKKQTRFHRFFETKDGVKIFYITNTKDLDPDRPLLIFNYGLVCNTTQWDKQYEYFEKKGFQVLLHDYRCHHQSSCTKNMEGLTFKRICQDINELVRHLKMKKVILFGNSMGVNVSLEYMRMYPKKTAGAVLISGSVKPADSGLHDTNIIAYIIPYVEMIRKKLPRVFNTVWKTCFFNPLIIKGTLDQGFNKTKIPEEVIVHYLKKISNLSPDVFFQLFKETNYHNIGSYLKKIKVPVLIIGGNKDKVIPPAFQRIMYKEIKNSEIYIMKEGSHMPHMEFPRKINNRILDFINRNIKVL